LLASHEAKNYDMYVGTTMELGRTDLSRYDSSNLAQYTWFGLHPWLAAK